tara:strand:+ start:180 stop:809 length:630 start_codon:yes stop_codon:yes gene_type:complete
MINYKKKYFKYKKKYLNLIRAGMESMDNTDFEGWEGHIFSSDKENSIRKIFDENNTNPGKQTEMEIAQKLFGHTFSNVVNIKQIGKDYIDFERLDTENSYDDLKIGTQELEKYLDDIEQGLNQLNSVGINYIDLKIENTGYSKKDENWKIFDFDCSAINVGDPGCSSPPLEWLQNNNVTRHLWDSVLFRKFKDHLKKEGPSGEQYAYLR